MVLVLFTLAVFALLIFGAHLRVPTVLAVPSFTSGNPVPLGANTCAGSGCHTNIGSPGTATVTGFPAGMTYTPGTPIPLTVTVNDTTQSRFGFELTARLANNTASAAGTFAAGTNSNTATDVVPVVQGLASSPTFTLTWTPPPTASGNVNFYLTGLAGSFPNADLYTAMYTLAPAAAPAPAPTPPPDFSFSASPGSLSITQGANGSSTVSVSAQNSFSGSVGLSATGLPSGLTAAFNPASITSSGNSTLTLTASSAAATGPATVTVRGTSGALTHTATIGLTVAAAAPAPAPPPPPPPPPANPTLSVSPSSLSFAAQIGGAAPASKQITVTSSGASLNYSTSVGSGAWLTATPATGATGTTGGTVTVSLKSSGLSGLIAGTYSDSVTITPTGTSGTAVKVPITLTVNAAASTSDPTLAASPTSLQFTYQTGGSYPPSKTLTITSSPSATVSASYTGGSWVHLNPSSGTAPLKITVSVSPRRMSPGSYNGLIQVSAPGATTLSVPVTLSITSGGSSNDGGDDGGSGGGGGQGQGTMYAEPFTYASGSSSNAPGGLAAVWVDHLGVPQGNGGNSRYSGLVLSIDGTVPADSQVGALIQNAGGLSLTELGFDLRVGSQCTKTSPRFVVMTTDGVTHVYACAMGTIAASSVPGWRRVRFDPTSAQQTTQPITPGEQVKSIALVLDQGPGADPSTAGGLAVIDNIDVNGTIVAKQTSTGQ